MRASRCIRSSRRFVSAFATRSSSKRRVASATYLAARSKASAFAFDGRVDALTFRTNCKAASRASSSDVCGSKLWSTRVSRHIEPR